jgi:ABC-type Zn uptake system ZnuABC Zn-binding protein ZnuA
MRRCISGIVALSAALALFARTPAVAQNRVRVVTTLPTYAALAREITGDLADVEAIARGDVDPHFVNPRPSFAAMMRSADLFVTTGLDLELWVPTLLDRANNSRILDGAPGQVVAYAGVRLLDIPESVSRTGGDVHVFGNPHIHTSPINAITIARNITAGLKRVDAQHGSTYDANLADLESRLLRRLFGTELVDALGEETLFRLAATGEFWSFVEAQSLGGRPLTDYLGGWLAQAAPFRNRRIVCYHKNWAYFSDLFRIECAMYVEPKPGIPPSPGHVGDVMSFIRDQNIQALLAANHFSRSQVERVASRTGVQAVIVPLHEGGEEGINDYFALVDAWVNRLVTAFQAAPSEID